MYEISPAVDIFSTYTENWCEKVLKQEKWSEKKEMLDLLIKASTTPKLKEGNHFGIMALCKRLLNDSNVNLSICSVKIMTNLASGIRKPFSGSARNIFGDILIKLRDQNK